MLLKYFKKAINLLINLFYYLISNYKSVCGIKNNLVLESATSLAKKIRDRKITSEEIVRVFIERINEVNPLLNAVVDDRFDEAIEEAKLIDLNIKNGKYTKEDFETKPFLGIFLHEI